MVFQDELLLKSEVAELCRVKQRTVHSWVQQGLLKPIKAGRRLNRFRRSDIEKFLIIRSGWRIWSFRVMQRIIRIFTLALAGFLLIAAPPANGHGSEEDTCEGNYKGWKKPTLNHSQWVESREKRRKEGARANLCEAQLWKANLSEADLGGPVLEVLGPPANLRIEGVPPPPSGALFFDDYDAEGTNCASIGLLNQSQLESPCFDSRYIRNEIALNQISDVYAHSGLYSIRIGGNGFNYGKLHGLFTEEAHAVKVTYWIYFPTEFSLPGGGEGFHIFRLMTADNSTLDFNVPFGGNAIQLFHTPGGTGGQPVVKWTSFTPASASRKGRWQKWEVISKLNTPGQSDGKVEFYADGVLVDSISGNFRGTSTNGYFKIDVQSNIGSSQPQLWPQTNWYYVDDVLVEALP